MRLGRHVLLAALVLTAAISAGACGGSSGETVRVVSEDATSKTTVIDLGAHGKTPGDMYVFAARLFDKDEQQEVGHVYGTQTSMTLESDAEVVQTMITFTFGGHDSITVGGISRYPRGDIGLIRRREHVRPILGGTGKYAGARGQLTTVRRADGRYEQTFHLEG